MDIATEAQQKFLKGDYDACLQLIGRLSNKTDAATHNEALCKLMVQGSHGAQQAIHHLERLAASSSGGGAAAAAGCDRALVSYNLAVALFQQQLFAKSVAATQSILSSWKSRGSKAGKTKQQHQQHAESNSGGWVGVVSAFLQLEACLYLVKSNVRETQRALELGQPAFDFLDRHLNEFTKGSFPLSPVIPTDGSWLMHVYKARFSLLRGSKKAAKKEIKALTDAAQNLGDQHKVTALMLRAQLAMIRNDNTNASETLASITQLPASSDGYAISDDAAVGTLFYNNMGVLNFKQKKFRASSFYFTKALTFNEKHHGSHQQRTKLPTNRNSDDKAHQVLYNLGVSLLLTGRPSLAFECFQEALPGHAGNALIWLRLAECCVASYSDSLKTQKRHFKVTLGVESGKRDRSRMILPTTYISKPVTHDDRKRSKVNRNVSDDPRSSISLGHAAECLRNALSLLRDQGDDSLRTFIVLNLAFVSLSGGDPMTALVARELVNAPNVSPENANRARVYVAEAYLQLNMMDKALELLKGPALGESVRGSKTSVRLMLLTNLITVYILRDELDLAAQTMKTVMGMTNNPSSDLYLLQAYLCIRAGDTGAALELLKRGRPLPKRK